jgi:non-reducing end alpha-L-arabinofuranosidase
VFGKHNGIDHWQLKSGNAKEGALMVNIDESALPDGYSPLRQEGGLGLGEGGAGDSGGSGAFSEGAVIAGETSDETDEAIQASIVSVYGR